MASLLRVMVVDDTITYRMIMKKVAESIPGIQVVATASNGKLALDKLANQTARDASDQPDVVLLDVEMPVMDGLTSLKGIKEKYPHIAVVMVSALSRSNANIVMECLNAGALDFVTKPLESNVERAKSALRRDLEPILSIIVQENRQTAPSAVATTESTVKSGSVVEVPVQKKPAFKPLPPLPVKTKPDGVPPKAQIPAAMRPSVATQSPVTSTRPDLVLIGSSTGGPAALTKVLGGLRKGLLVPILIVQHMPPVFTASLAAQLSRTSGLPVSEAQDGLEILPGTVTIAQGGRHMTVQHEQKSLKVLLNDGPKVNECRPAVDVLFMSVMAGFKGKVLAVVLTGMGRDGANGVDALKRAGQTFCITQDKGSCVVYGMPRSVDEKGLSDLSLPLEEIGPKISDLCA